MTDKSPIRLNADTTGNSVLDTLASERDGAAVSEAVNDALKAHIAALLAGEPSDIVELIATLGPLDLRANKDTPIRTLLAEHARERTRANPELQAALDAALARLPEQTTLGELLSLELPLREHPLFQDAARKATLDAILSTSPALADNQDVRDEFINLYASQAGPTSQFWEGLAARARFGDPALIGDIQTTLQLGLLTRNNPGLVRAIRVRMPVESLRDLTQLERADWTDLIRQGVEAGTITIPATVPGDSVAEQIDNYAAGIVEQLTVAFPTVYVAKEVAKGPDLDLAAAREVLRRNPDLDILTQPDAIDWGDMSAEDQARAMTAIQALQREARMFPGFDYRAALAGKATKAPKSRKSARKAAEQQPDTLHNPVRQAVAQFFASTPDFDFRTAHVDSFVAQQSESAFPNDGDRKQVTAQLKSMQRVFQVTPSYQAMSVLMGEGLDSAHKIASIPQQTFVRQFQDQLGGEAVAQNTYARAEFVTAATAQLYTQISQAINDVQPRALLAAAPDLKNYPDLATLFGQVNLCECKDCRSVYSPAAYFVDLLHTLQNAANGSTSPLAVLLARRPDLEYIKLTCENTNTALPYVDLVNEILESYVVLGKLDQTVAKDTGTTTTEELNAEPQYTNSAAYDILKQAVFPMSLPFDLPVEIARAYLEQLGSSRYEVMDTFQRNGTPTAVERAGEYLSLSPSERTIILDQLNLPTSKFYGYDTWSAPNDTVWVEDALPPGATAAVENDAWTWITTNPTPFSGQKAHQSNVNTGPHQHFFTGATPGLPIAVDDYLFAYVYLDPANPPREVVLQWNDGTWDHRAYWGANLINWGVNGTNSMRFMGALPPAGQWARLEVPAKYVGLEGKTINGMAFSLSDGRATWDRAGKSGAIASATVFLRQTGLEFTDLVELLKTRFLNPAKTLTLDAPADADPCSLDQTKIKNLDDPTLRKMQRFIRLWRKLGGTIQELDKVLTAFQATDITTDILQKLAQVRQLQDMLHVPLVQLLSLWANIDTQGDASLYKAVFLNRAVINPNDPNDLGRVFLPNSDGSVLTDSTKTISNYAQPLQAAFWISAADLNAIRADARLDPANTPLTLANVSLLYHYTVLAKALKLSIRDFIDLKILAGVTVDPFSTPDRTIQFVQIVRSVQQSGFSLAQLNYLYRHLLDAAGAIAPQPDNLLLLAKTLHDGLANIAASYAVADDPTGDLTRARLGERFESGVVDQLIRTLDGSAVYTTPFNSPNVITFPTGLTSQIVYDGQAKLLRVTGPLSTADRDALLNNVLPAGARSSPTYQAAIANLFQQPRTLIAEKGAAFLNVADAIAKLLDNQPPTPGTPPLGTAAKMCYVLEPLSNYLKADRSYALVKQTVSTALRLDLATVELLLQRLNNKQILNDALALATSGVSAVYFSDAQLTTQLSSRIDPLIALDGSGSGLAAPAGTTSARWTATLLAPGAGPFRFFVRSNGAVRLWIGNSAQPLMDLAAGQATAEATSDQIDLKAGGLYQVRLEIRQLGTPAIAELRWSGAGTPKALVPAANLYPASLVDAFSRSFTLLHKITMLANGFVLTSDELAYLLDHPADFAGFDLQLLPLDRNDPAQTDARAVTYFKQWQRLSDLVTFRSRVPASDVRLIDVFAAATFAASLAASDPRRPQALADVRQKLLRVTSWDGAVYNALTDVAGFNLTVDAFKNEVWLLRLHAAIQLINRLGVTVAQLFQWATTPADAAQAQDIKRAAKAKYDAETWLALSKSLNDELRERQRAALVAYLLPRLQLSDSAQLFELFLIDVDMSACMPTSRIKQAIASVQLFVQRCLMNLEPSVSPLAIDATLWQWMKHYRTWEANRRVFLYPENWIEPELRDDKSPFLKELQTELLQTDLTPDAAETAFLHYLEKLDQVARLEICGTYWQLETDQAGNVTVDVLHVFGRTLSTPQIYYYRQLKNRTVWTPWERMSLDISGDHLIPVVFNRRLYLFWPVFTQRVKTIVTLPKDQDGTQPTKYWEISLAWSEYKQGKWLPKQVSTGAKGVLSTHRSFNYIVTTPEDLDRRQYVFRTVIDTSSQKVMLNCQRARSDKITSANGLFTELFAEVGQFVLDPYGGVTAQDVIRASADANLRPSNIPAGSEADAMMFAHTNPSAQFTLNSTSDATPIRIFNVTPVPYHSILPPHQFGWGNFTLQGPPPYAFQPFFYQDDRHTYFVLPETVQEQVGLKVETRFKTHYHPYVWSFIRSLNTGGIRGLLGLDNQRPNDKGFVFYNQYQPTYRVPLPYPEENVDFSYGGAYTLYNWELFFHAPMLIASRLSRNQQWEQAQKWFHYIFDPTNPDPSPAPSDRTPDEWARERYWKVLPFQLYEWDQITSLLDALNYTGSDPETLAYKQQVIEQINQWMRDPFNPHRIARLRQVAYQKHVLMKYIDNLVGWGDYLFRQYTPESIQEATQLYVLAAELLGPRPQRIPPRGTIRAESYNTLKDKLDSFSNALVTLENQFPFSTATPAANGGSGSTTALNVARTAYFGIPQNDKLLGYWDTVDDRLFKIRHCMNIEGVVQQLPLFAPPIDPGLLVQAAAAGVSIGSALNDVNAPVPYYRFQYMTQKTQELCNDLRSLGGALLSALEKRDAEALALLRSTHEIAILNAARMVKEQQIEESKQTLEGLQKSRLVTQARYDYYSTIPERIDYENVQIEQLGVAQDFQIAAQVTDIAASIAHTIPDFDAGVSGPFGSPVAKLRYGGQNIGNSLQAASRVLSFIASLHSHQANMASIQGGWKRRSDEWALQAQLAQKELDQIDKQILAMQIRQAIAEQELRNHDLQVQTAKDLDDFMRRKYTNQELYEWMASQTATIYFQTYQLAYDLAKRAEKAYRFERGVTNSSFIQFGYWDSMRKGLLAGEQLSLALRQMESAYMEQNKREYEITKQVSLMLHDPLALIALKETGQCLVTLPEAIFDTDYPGHYMRRIRSVSLTIPAVVGPYTSINGTLTLLSNKLRTSSNAQMDYAEQDSDSRFITNFAAVQSITTSHAQNDTGLFELNFHDERYLPFEGAGAVSEWRIDLPKECNAFDFDTISDVIIKISYTAREGGDALRQKAWGAVTLPQPHAQRAPLALGALPQQNNLFRLYSARHEFPSEWYRFLNPPDVAAAQSLAFALTKERFPFQFRGREIRIHQVELFWKLKTDANTQVYREQGAALAVALTSPAGASTSGTLASLPSFFNGLPHAIIDVGDVGLGAWTLTAADGDIAKIAPALRHAVTVNGVTHQRLNADAIEDLLIVCRYAVV